MGSRSNSQLLLPSWHGLADAGVVRAHGPELLVGSEGLEPRLMNSYPCPFSHSVGGLPGVPAVVNLLPSSPVHENLSKASMVGQISKWAARNALGDETVLISARSAIGSSVETAYLESYRVASVTPHTKPFGAIQVDRDCLVKLVHASPILSLRYSAIGYMDTSELFLATGVGSPYSCG